MTPDPKPAKTGRNLPYMQWVRSLPCLLVAHGVCNGPIQAHHAGPHGMGKKASDETCIPLCMFHHNAWHGMHPPFSGPRELRRAWAEMAISFVVLRWQMSHGKPPMEVPF